MTTFPIYKTYFIRVMFTTNPLLTFSISNDAVTPANGDTVRISIRDIEVFTSAGSNVFQQPTSAIPTLLNLPQCSKAIPDTVPPVCPSCTDNLIPDSTGVCNCPPGYYKLTPGSSTCLQCSTTFCDECDPQIPSFCKKCSLNRVADSTGKCICETGFEDSFGKCITCKVECQSCKNTDTCETCKTSYPIINQPTNFNPVPSSGQCVCQNGYYLTTQGLFPICSLCTGTLCANCLMYNGNLYCSSCLPNTNSYLSSSITTLDGSQIG